MKQLLLLCLTALALSLVACGMPATGEAPAATATALPMGGGPTEEVTPSPTPPADATGTPLPTTGDEGAAALPAPLYYLNAPVESAETWQIWRLEADGVSATPITSEARGVQGFDISPVDGSLAYLSGLEVVRTDAAGGARTVLYTMREGQAGVHPDVPAALTEIHWSPDGLRLAFGLNGVNLIAAAGGSAPEVILPSSYSASEYEGTRFYAPVSWSPDGTRLLVRYSYYPDGSNLALVEPRTGTLTEIAFDAGMPCCEPTWSADSSAFYLASPWSNFTDPGLWRVDAATGAATPLVAGKRDEVALPEVVVSHVQPAPDGSLFGWRYDLPAGSAPDALFGAAPTLAHLDDPARAAEPLAWERRGAEALTPMQALWATDFSGALVTTFDGASPYALAMSWVPADGAPARRLPIAGFNVRWGQ